MSVINCIGHLERAKRVEGSAHKNSIMQHRGCEDPSASFHFARDDRYGAAAGFAAVSQFAKSQEFFVTDRPGGWSLHYFFQNISTAGLPAILRNQF